MSEPVFETPEVEAWCQRQLKRAREYRAMIQMRKSGKSLPMALCAEGTKVLLLPDDPGYTAAAYRALKIFDLQMDDDKLARYQDWINDYEVSNG